MSIYLAQKLKIFNFKNTFRFYGSYKKSTYFMIFKIKMANGSGDSQWTIELWCSEVLRRSRLEGGRVGTPGTEEGRESGAASGRR